MFNSSDKLLFWQIAQSSLLDSSKLRGFSSHQCAHSTIPFKCDKLELAFWILCNMPTDIQLDPDNVVGTCTMIVVTIPVQPALLMCVLLCFVIPILPIGESLWSRGFPRSELKGTHLRLKIADACLFNQPPDHECSHFGLFVLFCKVDTLQIVS